MNKVKNIALSIAILLLLAMCLVACNIKFVTSVPPAHEVVENLEQAGYIVTVDSMPNYYTSTKLEATKGDDYLVIYWVIDKSYCDFAKREIGKKYNGAISTIEGNMTDSVVLCGTDQAIEDAKLGTFSFN